MEIREYWLALGRRRWALVLAPLLAGLLALAAAAQRPGEFEATTTVLLPSGGDTDNPPITRQLTANVDAVLESDLVASQVSQETGVPAGRIADRLEAERAGEGNLVEVRYRGTDPEQSEQIADLAAREGLRVLLDGQDAEAEQLRQAAQANYDRAQEAIDEFLADNDVINPSVEYQAAIQALNSLRNQLINAQNNGDDSLAARLSRVIKARQNDLDELGALLREFTPLTDAAGRAGVLLQEAEGDELDVAAQLATIDAESTITTQQATAVPRLPAIMQLVGLAVIVSLLIVIGVLLLGAASTPPRRLEGAPPPARTRARSGV